MFHHQHCVADVAQPHQGVQQTGIVAGMQPDGRLIQHVQHTHQPGADLGCQPDALRLAAGKRLGGAVEGQVFQTDIHHELQPFGDLFQHPVGDDLFPLAQRRIACR